MGNELMITAGIIVFICVCFGLHSVPEGYVGVYFRGGALIEGTTDPGFHVKIPLITSVEYVQVTLQTDSVLNIPCGTSAGVTIWFERIEVVNRLSSTKAWETIKNYTVEYDKPWIFDKIHHEINQFCSKHTLREVFIDEFDQLDENLGEALQKDCNKWAPGIEIIAVRVTKPRIPDDILQNFERMEKEKTNLMINNERQKIVKLISESDKNISQMKAETEAIISQIKMKKELMIKNSTQEIERIENLMYNEKEKAITDAEYYRAKKQKEIESQRISNEYLKYKLIGPAFAKSEIWLGSKIPKYITEPLAKN